VNRDPIAILLARVSRLVSRGHHSIRSRADETHLGLAGARHSRSMTLSHARILVDIIEAYPLYIRYANAAWPAVEPQQPREGVPMANTAWRRRGLLAWAIHAGKSWHQPTDKRDSPRQHLIVLVQWLNLETTKHAGYISWP